MKTSRLLSIPGLLAFALLLSFFHPSGFAQEPAAPAATPALSPSMAYRNKAVEIIFARWRELAEPHVKELPKGDAAVHIYITAAGKVKEITVVHSDSKILTDLARKAIMEAKLPPIPENARSAMKNGVLEVEGSFSVYPPQEGGATEGD